MTVAEYKYVLDDYYPLEQRAIISKYLDEVKYDGNNNEVIICLAAVIVRIVKIILDKKYVKFIEEDKQQYLIMIVNVDNITNKLIDYYENFLPVAYPYLKNVDAQAELISLFCDNYVLGLVERLRRWNSSLVRELKIKELKNN